jgi:hypothetical protein
MQAWRRIVQAGVGVALTASGAWAQLAQPVILHRVNSSGQLVGPEVRYNRGQPISVDITSWNPGDGIHVFLDPLEALDNTDTIGRVTINGLPPSQFDPVRVLIGNASRTFWPPQNEPVSRSGWSWNGLSISEPFTVNSVDLTVSIDGDIAQNVQTGRITLLRAFGGLPQGVSITAANFIERIWLEKPLAGTVTSFGPIADVWVNLTPESPSDTDGITGSISTIGAGSYFARVETGGNIGTPTTQATIRSDSSLDEVVAFATDPIDPQVVYTRNINATIEHTGPTTSESPTFLIQASGSISGNINLQRLGGAGSYPNHAGIYARGTISSPIRARKMEYADIVANTFAPSATIEIDARLKGSIVAVDPVNGYIPSIRIGRGVPFNEPTELFGFNGSQNSPISPDPDLATPPGDQYYNPQAWGFPLDCGDLCGSGGGTMDAVIRAASIGSIDIAVMAIFDKMYPPRIEAQQIGSLLIGNMEHGIIWSGNLFQFSNGQWVPDNTRSNDYASIGIVQIGCMGASAALWVKDCADIRILNSMEGQIHLPELKSEPQFQQLRIGDALTNDAFPTCRCPGTPLFSSPPVLRCEGQPNPDPFWANPPEESPRSSQTIARGLISLAGTASLNGQIILHANAPSTQLTHDLSKWQGDIVVGAELPNPIIFNTDPSTPLSYRGPEYTKVPTATPGPGDFGSGAIGLVPFAVHRAASQFDETCIFFNRNTNGPFGRAFNYEDEQCPGLSSDPLEVEYYGPVAKVIAPSGFQQRPAVDLTLLATSGNLCAGLADASWAASTTISANQRRVSVSGSQFYWFPNGKYGYKDSRPSWGNTGGLRCDKLLTTALVRPLNSTATRYFSLFPDCDSDCQKDTGETTCPPGDPVFGCDDVDFNNDGSVFDPTDVDAFLSVFSEGPCVPNTAICNDVDFNNDGSSFDPCDVDSFLVRFAEGPCTACGQ